MPNDFNPSTRTEIARVQEQARAAMNARIKAIVTSPEAKALPGRAQYYAFETNIPATSVIAQLKVEAKQQSIAASWKKAADRINRNLGPQAVKSDGGELAGKEPAKPLTGWQKAAADANRRFGDSTHTENEVNHLEKYLPKRKDASAQSAQRDHDLWAKAISRVNGHPRDPAKEEARNDDGTGRLNNH